MADFDVKLSNLNNSISSLKGVKRETGYIYTGINSTAANIHFHDASAEGIRRRLRAVASDVNEESRNLKRLSDGLEDIRKHYLSTELDILDNAGVYIYDTKYTHTWTSSDWDFIKTKSKKDFKKKKKKTWKKGYYDIKKKKWVDETPRKRKDGYDWGTRKKKKSAKEKFKDSLDDVKLISYSNEGEVTWIRKGYDDGNLSYDMKIGDAKAEFEAYGGFLGFDENGNKIFRPGVGVTIGASATAFAIEGQALLGDDNLGVYVGGDVTAGKVSGQVDAQVGFGKDGKFRANVSASAEAIAVEANANIGAKVLGTDIKGNVGVNVGIGAHFDAGYSDGKLRLDLGASVGLGVSANLEIDVSGTVEKVGQFAGDVAKGVGDVAKGVGSAVSGAVSGLKSLFKW